jgi:hypothetical protein
MNNFGRYRYQLYPESALKKKLDKAHVFRATAFMNIGSYVVAQNDIAPNAESPRRKIFSWRFGAT